MARIDELNNPYRKKTKMDIYRFAIGSGMNWVDLNTGELFHIQEYVEKMRDPTIPRDEKPDKIKVSKLSDPTKFEWLDPILVEERMKKSERADPRY